MAKKPSKKTMICRNIRAAFRKAEAGNEKVARQLWQEAINLGYEPNPHTAKGIEVAIERGSRGTAKRDTL